MIVHISSKTDAFRDDQILGAGEAETRLCGETHHSLARTWVCSALLGHPGEHRWMAGDKPKHWDFVDEDGCAYCNCGIGVRTSDASPIPEVLLRDEFNNEHPW